MIRQVTPESVSEHTGIEGLSVSEHTGIEVEGLCNGPQNDIIVQSTGMESGQI
jgi:hypothetical protein